jgi:hypothetical protein
MRTDRWWFRASLGLALLLASYGLRAQPELIPGPRGGAPMPVVPSGTHTTLPQLNSGPQGDGHDLGHHGGEELSEGGEEAGGGLFGTAEFLLVRPRRRPDDFAIVDPQNNAFVSGSVNHFDLDTTGAYRVGLGYRLANGLEVDGVYTYLHSKDDQALGKPTNGQLFATLSAPITFDSANSAIGGSNLDLDVIDVEFARRWEPCKDLGLRFVAGLRIASIDQKTSVAYDFGDANLGVSNVNDHLDFEGIGLRVGTEGWWGLRGGLGIYAKAFASLMSGELKTSFNQTVQSGRLAVVDVSDKFEKVIPVSELGLGLGWHGDHLTFRVGYELQNYFGMVDRIDFNDSSSFKPYWRSGDLSLEALTVTLGFAY